MSCPLVTAAAEWYKSSGVSLIRPSIHTMPTSDNTTQRTQALALLKRRGMTRLAEFSEAGITATTVGRMERAGEVVRLARGLYQLPDAALDAQQSLAEASRLVPKGVICLASALAFRFSDELLRRSVERKKIAGTTVPVFGVAKTVADLFRYRRTVGDALAIEGLRQALRRRRATPAEIAREAEAAGVWATMEPYVMALTSDA